MARTVFFVSDGTGITAETLGHSLLTQFDTIPFSYETIPYLDNETKAQEVLARVEQAYQQSGERPLIFATLIDPAISKLFAHTNAVVMDFFKTFINPLEAELGRQSSHTVGKSHGMQDYNNYMLRIQAVNYALNNDDGVNTKEYDRADIILVGVSRCGKTPTCLYLALQFGIYAANYPFVETDLEAHQLPKALMPFKHKLFGLTINPERLQQVRQERRPNSDYAAYKRCAQEVARMEDIYLQQGIDYLSTTQLSIEEIATRILSKTGIKRRLL